MCAVMNYLPPDVAASLGFKAHGNKRDATAARKAANQSGVTAACFGKCSIM